MRKGRLCNNSVDERLQFTKFINCRIECPFFVQEVDRFRCGGGQGSIENLRLLCAHCRRSKGGQALAYFAAVPRELRIVA